MIPKNKITKTLFEIDKNGNVKNIATMEIRTLESLKENLEAISKHENLNLTYIIKNNNEDEN